MAAKFEQGGFTSGETCRPYGLPSVSGNSKSLSCSPTSSSTRLPLAANAVANSRFWRWNSGVSQVPIGVSFTFAPTARSQRDENVTERENSFDNLLCRSARVECPVAVRDHEPIPFLFFGGICGGCSRLCRGEAGQPWQGSRAQARQSRASQAYGGPGTGQQPGRSGNCQLPCHTPGAGPV